ncbi:FMN-dependent NADH-azoreductase [Mycoplasma sp. M5725]|uniref:FMN-dependent NADH-azoreductase n=1 Tax=Mycoplasma phocimorsus TaxID=3045839 RepID=A0AAJ1PQU7_9MOLU|nr:FMN-dependent NADH-azoreductase [Mycoplasma phocimorsus]MDJ1645662.1 FMN-dependent NADH-azoreductase [Mycoplasma phocimorsus]
MKKVLVLKTSINAISITNTMLEKFLEIYKDKNSEDQIITLDLNDENLIPLTKNNFQDYFQFKKAEEYIQLLKEVDKIIICAPMYNFNIPVTLKIFFDMVAQAKKTFLYKYDGKNLSKGLLDHLSVQIISSQGAPIEWYEWADTSFYVSKMCEFLGMKISGIAKFAGAKIANFKFEEVDFVSLVKQDALNF